MDKFDQKILESLSENARQSNAEIARNIGLSRSAVSERIRNMEDQQIIQGYRVELKPEETNVAAYFQLSFSVSSCDAVISSIRTFKEVRYCHSTTGDVDMMIFAEAKSITELNTLRKHLEQLPNLDRIKTHTVLEERIRR